MALHESTFGYLKPTDKQMSTMQTCRAAALDYARVLELNLPDGPDKTFVLRSLRDVAMWCNIAITRHPDGSPRTDEAPSAGEAVKRSEAVT
jgi:hypothetical protein